MLSLPPEASELTACYGLICKGLLTPPFLCILKLPSSGFDWIGSVAFASRVFQWNNVTEYKPTPTNVTFSDRPWWVQSNGYCGLLHTTIMSFPDGQTVPGKWRFNKKEKQKHILAFISCLHATGELSGWQNCLKTPLKLAPEPNVDSLNIDILEWLILGFW